MSDSDGPHVLNALAAMQEVARRLQEIETVLLAKVPEITVEHALDDLRQARKEWLLALNAQRDTIRA